MRRPAVPAALRVPLFRRIWLAGFVSTIGDWMQIVGRGFLVYDITGSKSALGLVYFASYIPQLLLTPFGGVFADRLDRRRTLLGGQVAQTVLAVALGLLAGTGEATLTGVVLISLAAGTVQTMTMPAQMALTPSLVPPDVLPSAMSLGMTTNNLSRVVGPGLAGLLIRNYGVEWVFHVNALSFLAVIAAWLITRVPALPERLQQTTLAAMAEGWRHVRSTPALMLPIALVGVLAAIGLSYQTLGIAYVTDVLARGNDALGARYYGTFQAVVGFGGIVGIASLAPRGRRAPGSTLILTAVGFSLGLVALGFVRRPLLAFALCFVIGIFHFANSNLVLTLVQRAAPDPMRGRVMSILLVAWIGIFPITSLFIGTIATRTSIKAVFVGAGLICLAASLIAARWRHVVGEADETPEADARVPLVTASEEA